MNNEQPSPPDASTETPWRTLYIEKRRTARILGATTVAASLLAVGAGAWALNNADASARTVGPGIGQFGPPGGLMTPDGSATDDQPSMPDNPAAQGVS